MQIGINWWGKGSEELQDLRLLQSALRLSANQLTRDPRQLAPHLIGRLKEAPEKNFRKLVEQAVAETRGCRLHPLANSLMPPGGPLQRTLEGHSSSVNAVAITPPMARQRSPLLEAIP